MGRTTAPTRTANPAARTAAPTRTTIPFFRPPVALVDLGVSHLWTFREQYAALLSTKIKDAISGVDAILLPQVNLESIFTTGLYEAYLNYDQGDVISGNEFKPIFANGATSFSAFVFFGPDYCDVSGAIFGQSYDEETALADKKTFSIYQTGIGGVGHPTVMISSDGTTEYVVRTTNPVFTVADEYHFVEITYDSVAGVKIYVDGVSVATTVVSGTLPSGVFGGRGPIEVCINTAGGGQSANNGGKVGMFGIAKATAHSAAQASQLYSLLNAIGRYI